MKIFKYFLSFIILIHVLFFTHLVFASFFEKEMKLAGIEYDKCYKNLPAKAKWKIDNPSDRGKTRWSKSLIAELMNCLDKKYIKEDYESMIDISNVLKGMYGNNLNPEDRFVMEEEADDISFLVVSVTRELNKKFQMGRSALLHNVLIRMGAKEGGYCYQWTEGILKAMPQEELKYFKRHWAVHHLERVTENNAIIITKRGDSLQDGLVYDPWRGRGRPFWRLVKDDDQSWDERYDEFQILYNTGWQVIETRDK